ncbi:serine hydrolase domain-containing protein [Nonomuraea sp. NPDC003709]|uniref:serine hydrolase domain-containing protein n=1 Tax=Nonomuraea sp. NPDC003709 TaxID=3154450 RepID=UPI0033BAC48F
MSLLLAFVPLPVPASATDLAGLMDELIPKLLAEHGVPGAAVAAVSAGHQVVAKGYGYADRDRKIPADATITGFATASPAKTFTAAAVLQLVHEGRLDLDRDVNSYLTAFQIPNTFPGRPITLRHLLTHTAGFESNVLGTSWPDPADVEPLASAGQHGLPERVRPFDDRGLLAGGHRAFERSPVTLHLWLLYAGLVAFLAALVGMPVAALVRRLRGRPARHRLAWWLAWLTSGLVTVFVYGLAATIVIAPTDAILVGSPLLIGALPASSTAFVLTAGLVVCTTVAWWKGWWGLPGRISFTAYTAAGVAFMTIAYLYNMVGGGVRLTIRLAQADAQSIIAPICGAAASKSPASSTMPKRLTE